MLHWEGTNKSPNTSFNKGNKKAEKHCQFSGRRIQGGRIQERMPTVYVSGHGTDRASWISHQQLRQPPGVRLGGFAISPNFLTPLWPLRAPTNLFPMLQGWRGAVLLLSLLFLLPCLKPWWLFPPSDSDGQNLFSSRGFAETIPSPAFISLYLNPGRSLLADLPSSNFPHFSIPTERTDLLSRT